jgi:integrase/recombinase XerD
MTFYQSPRTDRALPRPVRNRDDRKAIDKLINAAPYPYRAIFTILRETGMRANEVLGLAVGDVVLDAGNEGLLIRSAKNRTERVQVLGPNATPNTLRRLRKHLRDLKKVADHSPLFFSNRGTRLSYDALNYQWWKLCQQHGLVNDQGQPRYTLHQLRHTRGTEMIEQRYPLHVVQKTLGHLDPRSTQVYVELAEDQLRHELESHRR